MIEFEMNVIIPQTGYLRLKQIVGDPKANPPIPAIIPVGKSTWWKWVKEGKAPTAIRLSPGITVWRAEDIHRYIDRSKLSEARID